MPFLAGARVCGGGDRLVLLSRSTIASSKRKEALALKPHLRRN